MDRYTSKLDVYTHEIPTTDTGSTLLLEVPSEICLLKTIRQWPYKKTSKVDQAVLRKFFDKKPFFGRPWNIFVLQPKVGKGALVVSFDQVRTFFEQVQADTGIGLLFNHNDLLLDLKSLPEHAIKFLGVSKSDDQYDILYAEFDSINSRIDGPSVMPTTKGSMKSDKQAKNEVRRQMQRENRLRMLDSASRIVQFGENYALYAIDVESWEKNHDIITEIGLTSYIPGPGGWVANQSIIESRHFLVKENRFYKNGNWVADASANFEFGQSEFHSLRDIQNELTLFFGSVPSTSGEEPRQRVLIGHDINGDIEYLRKLGYDVCAENSMLIFDTTEMWKAWTDSSNGISLSRLCNELEIDAWNLHNAGNDARYTMQAFLNLANKYILKSREDTEKAANRNQC